VERMRAAVTECRYIGRKNAKNGAGRSLRRFQQLKQQPDSSRSVIRGSA
jgi:hypothetical protein